MSPPTIIDNPISIKLPMIWGSNLFALPRHVLPGHPELLYISVKGCYPYILTNPFHHGQQAVLVFPY